MTAYLPRILPDEMLYSVLARTSAHRGVISASSFMTETFGRRHVVSSFDLPGHLAALSQVLGHERGMDVDAVIDGMTLFPFFTAFASETRRREARHAMKADMTGVHTRLGVAAFRIPPLRSLRFCPQCVDEGSNAGTEMYWRRSHQLPGVLVCADHGIPLRQSGVSLDLGDRHRFLPASAQTCPADAPAVIRDPSEEDRERLWRLARGARSLLVAPPAAADPAALVDRYRERLGETGLMRSARKVDQVALEDAFMSYWGDTLALLPRIVTDGRPVGGWLMDLVRSSRRAAHPVCHLLLSLLLDSRTPTAKPFGPGPWPCRNPLANHHGRKVVRDLVVRRDRGMRYGDFRCGCGYHYTRALSPDGVSGSPRYRSFGPLLAPALADMIDRRMSLRAVASRVGLDPKTVIREAAVLGVAVPWSTAPSGSVRPPAVRASRQRSGGERRRRIPRLRNWDLIDRRLERAAKAAVQEILQARPAERVTIAAIERRVAILGWIGRRRAKLPRTWATVDVSVEKVDEFRLRRLDHVLAEHRSAAVGKTASDIQREVGLPSEWLPVVKSALLRAVEERTRAA